MQTSRVDIRPAPRTHAAVALLLATSMLVPAAPFGAITRAGRAAPDGAPESVIRRDTYGVPHILASTERGAAVAQGYATAEDHFSLLARLFLRARGEQASVFGEAFVREDVLIRHLGIWQMASDRFGDLPPYMQAVLDGYAEGYNAYLAEHRSAAPAWAQPITGVDVLAHCRAVLLMNFSLDLRPWRGLSLREGAGSNMWAIGRERSESTYGLLLANPHLEWGGPFVFHEVHLSVPGRINVAGATLIGFPVVLIGFNERLGWSHTVNGVRADGVVELTLDPSRPQTYIYDGLRLPIRSRAVSVDVKAPNGDEVRTYTLQDSHFGPIIRIADGKAYAYRSFNLGLVNFLTQYNQMAKAQTLSEFSAALNMQQLPTFNIGYADRMGNIFYLFNGRIPARPRDSAEGVVRGDTSAVEWHVPRPIAELPQLINPPGGYVQNANNVPWYTTLPSRLEKSRFPFLEGDGLSLRAQISLQMLDASPTMTLDRMMTLKWNESLGPASRLKPDLVRLARQRPGRALAEAAAVLDAWDGRTSVDSRGAVLFVQWLDDYMSKAEPAYRQGWTREQPTTTPDGIGDPKTALAALQRAVAYVKEEYGSLDRRWGDVHRLKRGSLDLPVGGGDDAFRTMWYRREGKTSRAVGGDSYVLAVEFTPSPTAYSVLAYSQSSVADTPHFNDQLALFASHRYKRLWFSDVDVQQHLERSYRPGGHGLRRAAQLNSR